MGPEITRSGPVPPSRGMTRYRGSRVTSGGEAIRQRVLTAPILRRFRSVPIPDRLRNPRVWWPVYFVVIMLLAWRPMYWRPIPGIDPSWEGGLALSTDQHLTFGRDIVWTYGPLGFVNFPSTWVNSLGTISFLYQVLMRLTTAAALFRGARRSVGTLVSLVLAVIAGAIAGVFSEISLLFIVAIWALRTPLSDRAAVLLAAAAGAASGFQLLDKVSGGVGFTILAAMMVLGLRGRRALNLAAAVGAGIVAFLILWLALGQPLSAVWAYAEGSLQVSLGYADAMAGGNPGLDWSIYAALLVLAAGGWAAWSSLPEASTRRRAGGVLIWVALWYFAFKEGFVREDTGHVLSFFVTVLIAWFGFYWRPEHRGQALTSIGALLILALVLEGIPLNKQLNPSQSVSGAARDLRIALSSARKNAISENARKLILGYEGMDPTALRLVGRHTVAVYPNEIALAWADRLNWTPIPVLQSYTAYTPYLDRLDADFLSSARAPQRILFNGDLTIDGRAPEFDEPRTARTLLCRYRTLDPSSAGYLVLANGPNRCSTPHLMRIETSAWGQQVPVPPPPTKHSLVFVDISGVAVHGLESLTSWLYRPSARWILIDGSRYRLVEGTAGDGLPLRGGAGLNLPKRATQVPQATTIAVDRDSAPQGGRPITYRFYSQSYTVP
jgi:hypothetical protein